MIVRAARLLGCTSSSDGLSLNARNTSGARTATLAIPSTVNDHRQSSETSTAARAVTISNWPTAFPAIAPLLATPRRSGNQRLIITVTGEFDVPALPRA